MTKYNSAGNAYHGISGKPIFCSQMGHIALVPRSTPQTSKRPSLLSQLFEQNGEFCGNFCSTVPLLKQGYQYATVDVVYYI